MFDLFFPKEHQPAGFNEKEARKSFLKGGYYEYDFPGSALTLISLNSMFFGKKNRCAFEDGDSML